MSKNSVTKNHGFFYVTDSSTHIQKRSIDKIIQVVNAKAVPRVTDSQKKDTVPTVRDILNDFFKSTSVHGLQYFGKIDIKVGFCGKIFWACTIFTGFVCLSLMLMQFLHQYYANPTNTYIKTFYQPIFKAPFPAVTICSFSPIPLHRRQPILDDVMLPKNVSKELAMTIFKYGHYITMPYTMKKYDEIDTLKLILKENQWTVTDFLKILRPCEDITETCHWNGEHINCFEAVKISYTSYGLCCSFNYLLEELVDHDKHEPRPKPIISANYGPKSGLKLVIKKEIFNINNDDSNDYSESISNSDGILVMIHHSMDYPGLNTNSYILQKGRELQVGIKVEQLNKPPGMYHRSKKGQIVPACISNDKTPLEYLPVYRYSNCYANCRIRAMILLCGCLPYIYDKVAEFYHVDHCEIEGLICIQMNSKNISIVEDVQHENFTCSCRTPCKDFVYDGILNAINLMNTHLSPRYKNVSVDNAVLRVYMHSQTYKIVEKLPRANELYLLASIGGIFSLFLGCSFLSLVEVIYFGGMICRTIIFGRKSESPTKKQPIRRDNFTVTHPPFY